jgi:biopolymer transport protein ExbB/TolQ
VLLLEAMRFSMDSSQKWTRFEYFILFSSVKTYALGLQMSKKIINLEKETHSWKSRWEKSHQALVEMAADKQKKDEEFALASKQVLQLQKLCRTLQEERGKQQAKLKDCKVFYYH